MIEKIYLVCNNYLDFDAFIDRKKAEQFKKALEDSSVDAEYYLFELPINY